MNHQPGQARPRLDVLFRMAVQRGNPELVEMQLKKGSHVNAVDKHGATALILAAASGNTKVCRVLIDAGADIQLLDDAGDDALTHALLHGHTSTATLLRNHIESLHQKATSSKEVILDNGDAFKSPVSLEHAEDALEISAQESIDLFEWEPEVEVGPLPGSEIFHESGFFKAPELVTFKSADASSTFTYHDDAEDLDDYDLSAWEPEVDSPPPEEDGDRVTLETQVHRTIIDHVPIDSDEDWSDIEIELPDIIAPSRKKKAALDGELRAQLYNLFLSGLRNGIVSSDIIGELVAGEEEEEPDEELERQIRRILTDLGITVEAPEWCDFAPLEIFSEIGDELDDERLASEAVSYLIDLLVDATDAISIYNYELNAGTLLTQEQENELAQTMRSARNNAVDAIAKSSVALIHILSLNNSTNPRTKDKPPDDFIGDVDEDLVSDEITEDSSLNSSNSVPDSILECLHRLTTRVNHSTTTSAQVEIQALLYSLDLQPNLLHQVKKHLEQSQLDSTCCEVLTSELSRYELARRTMIECNLRLVRSISEKYAYASGENIQDICQNGNLGLMRAVEKFDPDRGIRFGTYASLWIRQSIRRGLDCETRGIRVPIHMLERVRKVERVRNQLLSRTGSSTVETIAAMLAENVEAVEHVFTLPEPATSLDDFVEKHDDDIIYIYDCVATDVNDPENKAMHASLKPVLEGLLDKLKPRHAEVLRRRFGLDDHEDYTLEELGAQFDLTRERIRQIEKKALKKLYRHALAAKLDDFLPGLNRASAEAIPIDGDDDD